MSDPLELSCAGRREGRFARLRRDPWRVAYNVLGGEWCGNTTAPTDNARLELNGHVYRVGEDGGVLWVGYPEEWAWHMGRREARRVAIWVLFRWWAWGEWFGLRRWLWVKALHKVCRRPRVWLDSSQVDTNHPEIIG